MKAKLLAIQNKLKVPKNQFNAFGKYKYRNCEDILEALKPLCFESDVVLTISDEIVEIAGRIYVKATALLSDISKDNCVSVSAYAREAEEKKGMDLAQITGATSSYARKYALNGLFAIDDTKDADTMNGAENKEKPNFDTKEAKTTLSLQELIDKMESAKNVFELKARWQKYAADIKALKNEEKVKVQMAKDSRKTYFDEIEAPEEKTINEPF